MKDAAYKALNIRYILSFILVLLLSNSLTAQITISGFVKNKSTNESLSDVNVILKTTDGKSHYSYTMTKEDGSYILSYSGIADSLIISVTGFNIKPIDIVILKKSQVINISVQEEALHIKEVIVKAESISRRGDTLNYYVHSYIDSIDRSIGDVLKRMPGIDVAVDGRIQYYGKDINKFYVEGMDMLKGRYGIATNNIQAKDIATVQVLENHQSVKVLRDIEPMDAAAINLKLKEKAKGTFSSVVQFGAGYKPVMWTGEITAMYFARKFQTLNTYKTNNTGDEISRELKSFYGEMTSGVSMMNISAHGSPPLKSERFLNNNLHTVSLNLVRKLGNNYELSLNGKYLHDIQKSKSSSVTTYFFPDTPELVLTEINSESRKTNDIEASLELQANTEKIFLKESISIGGNWKNDMGKTTIPPDMVNQSYSMSDVRIRNIFNIVKPLRRLTLNISSITNFNSSPSILRVTPLLYPELFGIAEYPYKNIEQNLKTEAFNTNNSLSAYRKINSWGFSLSASFNAELKNIVSSLNPEDSGGNVLTPADSLMNNIEWLKLNFIVAPGISYEIGKWLSIRLFAPIDNTNLSLKDNITKAHKEKNILSMKPYAGVNITISNNLKLFVNASLYSSVGGLNEAYSGYIMTNYRMVVNNSGELGTSKNRSYSTRLTYGNPILSLFGTLDAGYWIRNSDIIYGTLYSGTLSKIESHCINNVADGYKLDGRVSKRFDGIRSTITLSGGYSISSREVLRQGSIIDTKSRILKTGMELSAQIGNAFRLDYSAIYTRNMVEMDAVQLKPINILTQQANLNLIISKKLVMKLSGEHYFNGYLSKNSRSMFFLDSEVIHKRELIEYIVEVRNLFNTGNFNYASYSDVTNYIYSYKLRPLSVMFKIKFSIR
ncbi:MAG: hypothetical protein KBH88_04175 [Bacteroidales bacterium]|nr:hypothetical protein [Bacteroidales bacterium]